MKIAVAMSGGVDSSVAAALTVDKYGAENVFGVTMKLFCYNGSVMTDKSCCFLDSINDAASVCKQLGIKHYVINLEKEFEKEVINDFIDEYGSGRTPNPCIRCNSLIKFNHLLIGVQKLGADILVSGHYARIQEKQGVFHLFKGIDTKKDQSYFLYHLNQGQMAHIEFPIGEMSKPETRKLANKYGLKTAQKAESQDICFIDTNLEDFLRGRVKEKLGNIVNETGKVLGKHEGISFYTIGQRKGLGGGFPEPMYVIGLSFSNNEVVVGREKELYDDEMVVTDVHWTKGVHYLPAEMEVKIRYNSEPASAILSPVIPSGTRDPDPVTMDSSLRQNDVKIVFNKPQKAITPGQTAVFYLGDEVIGGGIITSTSNP